MNVLLTCAGRRNYLVRYFQEALQGRGRVFAADASAQATALYEADQAFLVPPVNESDYIETLLEVCRRNEVGMLVPLNDLELPALASRRSDFLAVGTQAIVSSPDVVDICFDKQRTIEFLNSVGLKAPKSCDSLEDTGAMSYPLVVKPRWGSASIGIQYASDYEELQVACELTRKRLLESAIAGATADIERGILIQEKLPGPEYGLDVVNDLNGNHVCVFVKRKLAMRAGETDRAVTVESRELEDIGATIGRGLRHIGNLDCDVLASKDGFTVLEMNPRFGGGYPFSHEAGANLPAALIAWANGKEPDADWLEITPNITSAKCDRLVIEGGSGVGGWPEAMGRHDLPTANCQTPTNR